MALVAGRVRIGAVRLTSELPRAALHGLYWKVVGWWMLLTICFGFYLFGGTMLVAKLSGASFAQTIGGHGTSKSIPIVALTAVGYLAFALALNVVMRLYLQRDVWARVLETTKVHHIEAAADVASRGRPVTALGEGFADGLDVAGF